VQRAAHAVPHTSREALTLRLRRPTDAQIAAFAARQASAPFSYPEVGATRGALPEGYRIDRATFELGVVSFASAVEALRSWRHYDGGRIAICDPRPPVAEGATVILLARHLGLWTLSACRVIYVIDEPRRFAFAYGTLEHVVRGEERFELRHADDGRVTFELTAFSVPAILLARLAAPLARRFQRQGGEAYARGLRRAIG
jgi:uncharacterized protein (UPF0548 family)